MNEQAEKYLKLARSAREGNDTEDAKKYYDLVRTEDPDNAEASFYYLYYRLWDGMKKDWKNNYFTLADRVPSVIKMVANSDQTDGEKLNLLQDMFRDSHGLWKTCRSVMMQIRDNYGGGDEVVSGFVYNLNFGDTIEECFAGKKEFLDLAVEAWKSGLQVYADHKNVVFPTEWKKLGVDTLLPKYTEKIKQSDPSYETPKGSGFKGCVTIKK